MKTHLEPAHLAMAFIGALIVGASSSGAQAYTHHTLYSFCNTTNCHDGSRPLDLTMDSAGDLFGTALHGGGHCVGSGGCGAVFELVAGGGTWAYQKLYDFCADPSCTDGKQPTSGLVLDSSGNLYGTVTYGGAYGHGAIFRLKNTSSGWKYSVLYSFCPGGGTCTDGTYPPSGLSYVGQSTGAPWDGISLLFGVATGGGKYGHGTVYEFVHGGTGWAPTVIHSFYTAFYPTAVVADGSGNLFGTTGGGGKYNSGILYRLAHGTWAETIFHNFCNTAPNCVDGNTPYGRLAIDAGGNLFGVTQFGGSCYDSIGCGVAFERVAGGGYSVIYPFCPISTCYDGQFPAAGMILNGAGDLYGTGDLGGSEGHGTVFRLRHGSFAETVLYSFCQKTNCRDGSNPQTAVLRDAAGNLFGTTAGGGTNGNYGTVFELTP